jgi:S1-C subfamily serine protease
VGIVAVLLAAAVGMAFGGTILYAYYDHRTNQLEKLVDTLSRDIEDRYRQALVDMDKARDAAKAEVHGELEPIQKLRAARATLRAVIEKVRDSVYLVETADDFGRPTVGSAFVVTADAEKSYLVTALSVVRAATKRPGPGIVIRKGDERTDAILWTWHEEPDLALLTVKKGSLPRLRWAAVEQAPTLGERVFAVAGVGSAGASITQGFVADISAVGIEHDATVTGPFTGGPLLNSDGEVLAIATPTYAPLGFTFPRLTFAPPIRIVCQNLLKCPTDATAASGAGERR